MVKREKEGTKKVEEEINLFIPVSSHCNNNKNQCLQKNPCQQTTPHSLHACKQTTRKSCKEVNCIYLTINFKLIIPQHPNSSKQPRGTLTECQKHNNIQC